MQWAISEGQKEEAYGLFLGLAKDPASRNRLKDALLFAGITDLQDTIINRGGFQNIGHKARPKDYGIGWRHGPVHFGEGVRTKVVRSSGGLG